MMKFTATRNALTLVELVLVLCILVALSGVAIPLFSGTLSAAAETATRASLTEVRDAMLEYWHDTKFVALDGVSTQATEADRFDIDWLFVNPVTNDTTIGYDPNTRSGWNGPYLTTSTADVSVWGAMKLLDGWNHPLTVQYVNPSDDLKDIRIVSAGPDGVVDMSAATSTASLTPASIGDDVYVALQLR